MERFKEGDTVAVVSKWGADKGTHTILKVLKTRLVLSNGERYDLEGYYLNHSGRGPARYIRKVTE